MFKLCKLFLRSQNGDCFHLPCLDAFESSMHRTELLKLKIQSYEPAMRKAKERQLKLILVRGIDFFLSGGHFCGPNDEEYDKMCRVTLPIISDILCDIKEEEQYRFTIKRKTSLSWSRGDW